MLNLLELAVGARVELADGRLATVVDNTGDGMWIEARPEAADDTELVHAQDILRLVQG